MSPVQFRKKQIQIIYDAMARKDMKLAELYYARFEKGLTTIGKAGLSDEELEGREDTLPIPGLKKLSLWEDESEDVPVIEELNLSFLDEDDEDDDF